MSQGGPDSIVSIPTLSETRLPRTASRSRSTSPLKFFASADTTKPIKTPDSQRAWTAGYLTDLRSNRPARPSGSRPFPGKDACSTPVPDLEPTIRPSSALSLSRPICSIKQPDLTRPKEPDRCSSAMLHRRHQSAMPMTDVTKQAERPLVQHPHPGVTARTPRLQPVQQRLPPSQLVVCT